MQKQMPPKWLGWVFGVAFTYAGWTLMSKILEDPVRRHESAGLITVFDDLATTLMFWTGAVVCTAMGVLMLYAMAFDPGPLTPQMRLEAEENKRRWRIQAPAEQWQAGRIRSRGRSALVAGWVLAVGAMVGVMPALWSAYSLGVVANDASYRWWFIAALVPTVLLVMAVSRHLRWRKYGSSIAELHERPTATNDTLRLTIRPERGVLPPGDATVRLSLSTRVFVGWVVNTDGHSVPDMRKDVLWQETKPAAVTPLGINASFAVPSDQPDGSVMTAEEATIRRFLASIGLDPKEGFHWILEVRHAAPGIDYRAVFDLELKRS